MGGLPGGSPPSSSSMQTAAGAFNESARGCSAWSSRVGRRSRYRAVVPSSRSLVSQVTEQRRGDVEEREWGGRRECGITRCGSPSWRGAGGGDRSRISFLDTTRAQECRCSSSREAELETAYEELQATNEKRRNNQRGAAVTVEERETTTKSCSRERRARNHEESCSRQRGLRRSTRSCGSAATTSSHDVFQSVTPGVRSGGSWLDRDSP